MSGLRVKIYGERNTGTNYLTELLNSNAPVTVLEGRAPRRHPALILTRNIRKLAPGFGRGLHEATLDYFFSKRFNKTLGWKHMSPSPARIGPEALAEVRFLMVTKNPYSWALSLFKKPYHVGGRDAHFEDFLSRKLPVMETRENTGPDPLTPIEAWNHKMRGYLALKDAARFATIIRYEDFLQDEFAALNQAAKSIDLPLSDTFVNVTKGVKRSDKGKTQSFYIDYYLNERWREKLSKEAIEKINATLDQELVADLGYRIVTEVSDSADAAASS